MDPQAILGPDPEPFKTLLSDLTRTTNKEQCSQAESLFNLCKQTHANRITLVTKLVQLLEHSPPLDVRAMSAILLRNTLVQKASEIRPALWISSPELRSSVKRCLLDCVRNRDNEPIINILGNTISMLAADNRFPEVVDFMFDGFASVDIWLKKSALLIFAKLGDQYVKDYLMLRKEDLHRVFMDCLGNGDVRITALSAVIKFLQCLDYSDRRSYKEDLRPLMLNCVTEASNEATAQEALVLLIELARTRWTFFTDWWPDFLDIAVAERFEEGTRHLAIEVVITSLEPKRRDLLPQLIINRLCVILMRMLLDIEDEVVWHAAENEDEDAGRSSNYIFGKQCLHRLATTLGGHIIFPVVYDEYLSAPNHEWQKHLAGLVALAQIAKRLSKLVMIPNLKQVVTTVLNSIESHPDHPRVRWAAINAIGELSGDLDSGSQFAHMDRFKLHLGKPIREQPDVLLRLLATKAFELSGDDLDLDLQFVYNSLVLPDLVYAMGEDPDSRVRLAAINVTVQLFADLDIDWQLKDDVHVSVLHALHGAICEFEYLLVQERAVDAMISISINYLPNDISYILVVTVGTLLERHASFRLKIPELRHWEDIDSVQTRIVAIRKTLEVFKASLLPETWTKTFNSLRLDQQAKCRSILEHGI